MNQQLILHKGTRPDARSDLDQVEAPPPTGTWFPLRHSQVLSTVERTLGDAGFTIQTSELGLSSNNARFFGTLTLGSPVCEGVSLAIGIRNSHDKTFPIGMCMGSHVLVCDNLAFSSDVIVTKKHTRFGEERFNEGISHVVLGLHAYREQEALRIERMRQSEIGDDQANSLILQAYERKIVSPALLPKVIREYRQPTIEDFVPRTRWSLLNAFTEVLKARRKYPASFASLTIRLQSLLDLPITAA
jgi:hypothetical protein